MILADTSVWVDHIRRGDRNMSAFLDAGQILVHPFVIGEVAMGNLPRRHAFLLELRRMPRAIAASDDEAMSLMERERLYGLGIGYVDLHLLAATKLTPDAGLWTRDRRLHAVAVELGVAANLPAH